MLGVVHYGDAMTSAPIPTRSPIAGLVADWTAGRNDVRRVTILGRCDHASTDPDAAEGRCVADCIVVRSDTGTERHARLADLAVRCACGEVITVTEGVSECGGEGEGTCCIVDDDPRECAELCSHEPHTAATVARAIAAHDLAVSR
jgi:hypothetical protein